MLVRLYSTVLTLEINQTSTAIGHIYLFFYWRLLALLKLYKGITAKAWYVPVLYRIGQEY